MHLGPLISAQDPPAQAHPTGVGLRSVEASVLRARLTPELPAYGITRVANITGFDVVGLPVHIAAKPQGATLSSGSGKGLTSDGSWVSAVMEACEQAVWERLVLDPAHRLDSMRASLRSMRRAGLTVAEPEDLVHARGYQWHDDLAIDWTPGWDLVAGAQVWIPECLVTPAVVGHPNLRPFVSGSNGLASGAHVLEALLSGLLEVIERDGLRLHTRAAPRTAFDAAPLLAEADPVVAQAIAASRLPLRVIDCTTEVGIPTFAAYLYDEPGMSIGCFEGSGAALTTERALLRAVTEAAQSRCIIIAGARDDIFEVERAAATRVPRPVPPEPIGATPERIDLQTGTLEGDLEVLVNRLAETGFGRVIAIRHTRADELVQVVRVVVPGLEGVAHHRAAPGRRARELRARSAGVAP